MDIGKPATSHECLDDRECLDDEVRCMIEGASPNVATRAAFSAASVRPVAPRKAGRRVVSKADNRPVKLHKPVLAGLTNMRPPVGISTGIAR